jgi:S-adenosylmethionine hydrolase
MPSLTAPVVAFLTDFGLSDGYVGVMQAVVLGIAPHASLIDITHAIPPQQVTSGAWVLASAYRYFPAGSVFVTVVDPGVGSTRHPLAMRAGDWYFVGPDNGLFTYVLAEQPVQMAVELRNADYHLSQVSATFHGRDIFSPVAAHIANGVALDQLGPRLDPNLLVRLPVRVAERADQRITGTVVHVDHFGNVITNIPLSLVPEFVNVASISLRIGDMIIDEVRRFFADATPGREQAFLYGDSSGYLAVAISNANAAQILHVSIGSLAILSVGDPKSKETT